MNLDDLIIFNLFFSDRIPGDVLMRVGNWRGCFVTFDVVSIELLSFLCQLIRIHINHLVAQLVRMRHHVYVL